MDATGGASTESETHFAPVEPTATGYYAGDPAAAAAGSPAALARLDQTGADFPR